MKTTVEISDALLRAAKRAARARGTTLRSLMEEGLRQVLREQEDHRSFTLRCATFRGRRRAPHTEDWEATRDLIYPDSSA